MSWYSTNGPGANGVTRDPNWEWDELVLACDLVVQNGWRSLSAADQQVAELSGLLRGLPLHPESTRRDDFRNLNGVAQKSRNIVTARPDYQGRPTNGSTLDKQVVAAFIARPREMRAQADMLREAAMRGDLRGLTNVVDEEETATTEGRLLIRLHVDRERDRRLRQRKIQAARSPGGQLACEACEFNFEEKYGERGRGYIECHHVIPLHVTGVRKTRLGDLALLCANCHRMIHAQSPWPTPAELRAIIAETLASNSGR